jgi:hypothetical protein
MTNLFTGGGSLPAFAREGKKGKVNKAPLPTRKFRLDKFLIKECLGPQIRNHRTAVGKAVDFQTHQVSQGEPKVGIQGSTFATNETPLLDLALTLACHDHGKVEKLVGSPVAKTRSIS